MKIIIRTDSSYKIGTGHVVRTVTLAEKLQERGAKLEFICLDEPGNMIGYIEKKSFKVHTISNKNDSISVIKNIKPDLSIVDSYNISLEDENKMREFSGKLMAIDDLARSHNADIILDQNLVDNYEKRYDKKVPDTCIKLFGPAYAILRDEFTLHKKILGKKPYEINKIMVFFGGTDPDNVTMKIIQCLDSKYSDIEINVVVGSSNPNKDTIKNFCSKRKNFKFHCQIDYMAELMKESDLIIGAGGTTTWERMCIGTPAIVISIADNQEEICAKAAEDNLIFYLGKHTEFSESKFIQTFDSLLRGSNQLLEMAQKGQKIVDGLGAKRITDVIFKNVPF